ncbi:hypothetical protein T492DRAFT_841933 [Pavlovales sp. CCMP2436]|nr:hypothetical protein T492DRAFT_841933 [Pavlovales sp. CCMP2436]
MAPRQISLASLAVVPLVKGSALTEKSLLDDGSGVIAVTVDEMRNTAMSLYLVILNSVRDLNAAVEEIDCRVVPACPLKVALSAHSAETARLDGPLLVGGGQYNTPHNTPPPFATGSSSGSQYNTTPPFAVDPSSHFESPDAVDRIFDWPRGAMFT